MCFEGRQENPDQREQHEIQDQQCSNRAQEGIDVAA
jgi:hypothetical protein